jgi:hypothetical protein
MPKGAAKAKTATSPLPWWLDEGDHECPHCGRMYVYELEFRCTDCDAAGCAHCKATHAEGHLVCVDCLPASPKGNHHGG